MISSRADIEGLVASLTDYINGLYTVLLLKTKLDNAPTARTTRVRELLLNAKMAQGDVNTLYQALYPAERTVLVRVLFLESFRIPNMSHYCRQLRLLFTPPNPSPIPIEPRQDHWLKVWVELDDELEERSGPFSLRTTSDNDLSVIPYLVGAHFSGGSPSRGPHELTKYGIGSDRLLNATSDKERKSVRFQTPSMSHPEVRQQNRSEKVIYLSELSRMFHVPKPPSEYDQAMLIDEPDMLSLRAILRSNLSTSHVNRIRLAASLTWNVICLINTPWIKQGLKAVDIFFIRDHDVIYVDDLLIRHSFDQEYTEHTDCKSLIQGQIFRLGIILLELGLDRDFDDLQEGQEPDHVPDELGERVLISRMIDVVYLASGTKYGDVVRRCVSFQFDRTLDSRHPKILEKIQVLLIREVLSPLEDLLKLFGSLDSEATIRLAGFGAISPNIEHLTDDSKIDDRAQGLQEPRTRPPIWDSGLGQLSNLRQYASKVYQNCNADTLALTRVMLAGM